MITEERVANAMGGKTARACDGCLRKRARWYCAADDAFLCQGCDASVHSANQLARRHERVRLEAASAKLNRTAHNKDGAAPVWHQGFTRKARTPRPNKALLAQQTKGSEEKEANFNDPLVPEIGSEERSVEENSEEQLLYQVPVFDPFDAELCCDILGNEGTENAMVKEDEENIVVEQDGACDLDDLHGFLSSDMDLAEFAADVESLLASGLDDDSSDIKDLGLLDCKEENDTNNLHVCFGDNKEVKVKDEEPEGVAPFSITREATDADWNFDYEKVVACTAATMMNSECKVEMKRNVSLRLNYEAVINAWASQGCPWTTGSRPEFNPDDCWPDCTGTPGNLDHHPYGGVVRCQDGGGDGGREARVSRYREKRRTRLFSKKIRYEVRKLNAEKRPRMKGRFVKRTPIVGTAATTFPNYLNK